MTHRGRGKHPCDAVGPDRNLIDTHGSLLHNSENIPVQQFGWFSQQLFVRCGPGDDISVVRVGPWHRGHNPGTDHLAIAFYKGAKLLKRYSTLDIAGGERVRNSGDLQLPLAHQGRNRAAVDVDRLSSDKGGFVRGEKRGDAGNVFRLPPPLD